MVQGTKRPVQKRPRISGIDKALSDNPTGTPEEQQAYRSEYQKDVTHRLRRIQGQVGAILEMIESDRSCEDIAQQMSAVRKAMDKAFYRMMTCSVMEAAGVCEIDRLKELERSTRILERYA
jgi:DNA-binding FrmR family transcriptional regulator